MNTFIGLLIPFLGTSLGAGCVFLMKDALRPNVQKALLGFAAGIMVAASVWSLLIPAINMSDAMGTWSFIPAVVGFSVGILFLLLLDELIPHLHIGSTKPEGLKANLQKSTMLMLAVTLHNIPEGMAVGVVFAGVINNSGSVTLSAAFALSIGIAIQNFPEGAIISMPMKSSGARKCKSFLYGILSGAVEPIGAVLTIILTSILFPFIPYFLSFAAGAMIYVVVEELIPEASEGDHSNIATIGFAAGFMIMMVLDVTLG